jgi:hypothetical protein
MGAYVNYMEGLRLLAANTNLITLENGIIVVVLPHHVVNTSS